MACSMCHPNSTAQINIIYNENGYLIRDEQYDYNAGLRRQIGLSESPQPARYLLSYYYHDDKFVATETGDRKVSYLTDGQRYLGREAEEGSASQ
jgi:hypothetical protein